MVRNMKAIQLEKLFVNAEDLRAAEAPVEKVKSAIERAIQSLKVVDIPIPKPKCGEVLIRMEAATCNPSDLAFLIGTYGVKTILPVVPGFEGMGTVVESGGGALGWWLKGKRVAVTSRTGGTWAEYIVAEAKLCAPLKDTVSDEQGATLLINSLTAVAMIEQVKSEGHPALIFNAACSALGYKIRDLAKINRIPVINIVRNPDQVALLKKAGHQWVLNSDDDHFLAKLHEMAGSLKATVAFDAIGGEMTGTLINAMPPESHVVVYGALSWQKCKDIAISNLIFEKKKLEGFWLSSWLKQTHPFRTFRALRLIQNLIEKGQLLTPIQATTSFDGWKDQLLTYASNMSEGKVILMPGKKG